jgi:hypothetical protein
MPGRGPQTFKKRQKEQQRKEKQQEKMAKRLARKDEKPVDGSDIEEIPLGPGHIEGDVKPPEVNDLRTESSQ